MDFHEFHRFSEDVMRFYGFQGSEVWKRSNVCQRGPAPIETFTRSQLPAISWISMDFHDFHRFSEDVMRFHGFQGSRGERIAQFFPPGGSEVGNGWQRLQTFAAEVLPL